PPRAQCFSLAPVIVDAGGQFWPRLHGIERKTPLLCPVCLAARASAGNLFDTGQDPCAWTSPGLRACEVRPNSCESGGRASFAKPGATMNSVRTEPAVYYKAALPERSGDEPIAPTAVRGILGRNHSELHLWRHQAPRLGILVEHPAKLR